MTKDNTADITRERYANITNQEAEEILAESMKNFDAYDIRFSVENMDTDLPVIIVFWKDGPSKETIRNLLPEWAKLPTTQLWRFFSKEVSEKAALIVAASGVNPDNIRVDELEIELPRGKNVVGHTLHIVNGSLEDTGTVNFITEKTPFYPH